MSFNKQYNTKKDYLERFNGESARALSKYIQNVGLDVKTRDKIMNQAATIGLPDRYPLEDTWNSSPYDKLNSIAIVSFLEKKFRNC